MGKIVAIANQKGGVGKTTTAVNLCASLAAAEKKTLLVDMDPQGNAGSGVGVNKHELEMTVYEVLLDDTLAEEAVQKTLLDHLCILPADGRLTGAEIELIALEGREFRLQKALARIKDNFEFVYIDCPPGMGLLTLNALAAADSVIIPV